MLWYKRIINIIIENKYLIKDIFNHKIISIIIILIIAAIIIIMITIIIRLKTIIMINS
jgi:hypothetical protein